MSDSYCSRCGAMLAPAAQACARCGTPVGPSWNAPGPDAHGWTAVRPDEHPTQVSYPVDPSYAHPTQRDWGAAPLPYQAPPPRKRQYPPSLVIAVVALVVALAAGVTLIIVATRGGDSHKVADTTGPSSSAPSTSAPASSGPSSSRSAPTSVPTSVPTSAPPTAPQVVTVTKRTTLAAPQAPAEPAPESSAELRSAFDSAVPVDTSNYGGSDGYLAFATPSGNIECAIYPDSGDAVQCAIVRYDFPQPGPDCDNGAIVSIDSYGGASYSGCATSPFAPNENSLNYGSSVSFGSFGCVSRHSGVSCMDLDTDTGFTLSRQAFTPVD